MYSFGCNEQIEEIDEAKKKTREEGELGEFETGDEVKEERERDEEMGVLHIWTNNVADLICSNFLMDKRRKGTFPSVLFQQVENGVSLKLDWI